MPRPQSARKRPGFPSDQFSLVFGLPPLVGLVRCPSHDLPCVCLLPATLPPPSANRQSNVHQSRSARAVSHDLDGLLHTPTIAPDESERMAGSSVTNHRAFPVVGLLHPTANLGSLRFRWSASIPKNHPDPVSHRRTADCLNNLRRALTRGLSRSAFRTLRRSPPASSRVLSPGPLPSCRCASIPPPRERDLLMATLDFKALLRCRVRSASHCCQ